MNRANNARRCALCASLALVGVSGCAPQLAAPLPDASALPDIAYCDAVRESAAQARSRAAGLLDALDDLRRAGFSCGASGPQPRSAGLWEHGALTCAARVHALDMATRRYFAHVDPDGVGPAQRVEAAGITEARVEEFLGAGEIPPEALVELWLADEATCVRLADPEAIAAGVAYVPAPAPQPGADPAPYAGYWTAVLAAPATPGGSAGSGGSGAGGSGSSGPGG